MEATNVITIMLCMLCMLASLDVWRQMAIKSEYFFEDHYETAVKSSKDFWKLGYRIEDLEIKASHQHDHFAQMLHHIDTTIAPKFVLNRNTLRHNVKNIEFTRLARNSLHEIERNDTAVYVVRCEKNGPALRVGLNDYRTDDRDQCQLFTSVKTDDAVGPQELFDLIPVGNDGAFALRSVINGLFVKAVPPPPDNAKAPWKLVIGGHLIGSAETFRLSDEGYLYSGLIGGFFTCAAGQMIQASPGKYGNWNHFILQPAAKEVVVDSYELVDLSNKVAAIQREYTSIKLAEMKAAAATKEAPVTVNNAIKICLAIPMTSKGTDMKSVADSPFWTNLFDSFMRSVDWRSNKYIFRFYLGFDRADPLYDTGDAWSEIREEFKQRAIYRMSEQMMNEESINTVLEHQLTVKLMHFDHLEGAPSQVVSQLVLSAYAEQFDYFYQVNDDTVIETPNWAPRFIKTLQSNPIYPNLGVTGPTDSNNNKIFTHSFTHATHIEIFGHLFPPSFKNWWSDDWISTVYGSMHTFRCEDVGIKHNIHGQKTGDINRYQVDRSAQFRLESELLLGHVQIDRWLKQKSLPRLPLPEICGYIPTIRYIAHAVVDTSQEERDHVVIVPSTDPTIPITTTTTTTF